MKIGLHTTYWPISCMLVNDEPQICFFCAGQLTPHIFYGTAGNKSALLSLWCSRLRCDSRILPDISLGSRKNMFTVLGGEALVWQGAKTQVYLD